MTNQILPDTNTLVVAEAAIAWELVLRSVEFKKPDISLDELIALYKKAVSEIHNANYNQE